MGNINIINFIYFMMKIDKWKQINIKDLKLRIIRENLRRLLELAVKAEIDRLGRLEDLYRQKRIENKQVPSHRKREALIFDQADKIMSAWAHSILRCSEGSMCKNSEIVSLSQNMSTLDKDMVWNPLLKHWICIDCYNFYYKSDSAKEELENLLREEYLL